ncbi:hypothetical protein [Tahibacter amnicola]|uniref:Uncharacterized protein n=1 Tax=Tahibacter amnicola TaxID=2976241 RepID=A0ABY6BJF0_9GAMM|nr:hypothetical protein [Tahibacter amnicola]UXI69887.1 hypothetical protein N4264_09750 [Tahibacter amnicola]
MSQTHFLIANAALCLSLQPAFAVDPIPTDEAGERHGQPAALCDSTAALATSLEDLQRGGNT